MRRGDIDDLAVFQHQAVLDLGIFYQAIVVNRCEWAHVTVHDAGVLADDGGATHNAVDDLAPLLPRSRVHLPANPDRQSHRLWA